VITAEIILGALVFTVVASTVQGVVVREIPIVGVILIVLIVIVVVVVVVAPEPHVVPDDVARVQPHQGAYL